LIDLDKFSVKQAKCDLPERISSLRSLIAKGWVLLKAPASPLAMRSFLFGALWQTSLM
jgi:hypothetical protein